MNDSPDNNDPPSRLSGILAGLIVLSIFLMPVAGFWWLRGMSRSVAEQNLLAHTRDMLVRHVARTKGQWPQSWDDLEPDFKPTDAGYGTDSLDVLQEHVQIDFGLDLPALLAEPPNPDAPRRVLSLKGREVTPGVNDANARLLSYLRSRQTAPPGPSADATDPIP